MNEDIKTSSKDRLGLYELKQYKKYFDKERSQFLAQSSRLKCCSNRIQPTAM